MITDTRAGWVTAAVLAGALGASCANVGDHGPGTYANTDGGGPDAGVQTPVTDSGPAASDTSVSDGGAAGLENSDIACADFQDDDHNGETDCSDRTGCGSRAICCVGSTDVGCCAAPVVPTPVFDLTSCSSGLSGCTPSMLAFGSPLPTIATTRDDGSACATGSTLAPQGSDRSDGGLVASATIDTGASTLAIVATLGISTHAATTLDGIAVGLTTQTDLAGMSIAHVRPTVAIVVSATDQTIRAVAGDIAFPTRSLATTFGSGCNELDVRIVTRPDATFDTSYRLHGASGWISLEMGRPFEPSASARLVTYGRSTNAGVEGVHAWLRSLSSSGTMCDVLDPVRATTGAFATLPGSGAPVRSVSRVDDLAVYETGGSIYVAGVDGTGHLQALGRSGADGDRILAPGEMPFMASALADPELVATGDNRRLFFTGIDAAGVHSIGYLDFDMLVAQRVNGSTPRQLVAPTELSAVGVDGPAYFETTSGGADVHRWIVFRAIVSATRSELRAAELVGSDTRLGIANEVADVAAPPPAFYTTASPLTPTQALYANRADDDTAFDHDEIASPELVVYRNVIRVFFAARHGARWSIGMLRSPDFSHFQLAYPDPVLAGSGAGLDAVSVSDPDATLVGDTLTLYYTASDGTTTQPALATQAVPGS